MKKALIFIATALALVGCNQNTPNKQTNQPEHPTWWSPAGHIYVCETTWSGSPARGQYWAFVLNFFSKDSCVRYETPNRDLSYHERFMHTIDSTYYFIRYPVVDYYTSSIGKVELTFIDTTKIDAPLFGENGITYVLIRK